MHEIGLLEAFVCLGCGVLEWYCLEPENIPEHPHCMTEFVDLDANADGPFR